MLDTILEIGKTLRKAGKLRHHRYIKPAPKVEITKTGSIKTDVAYLVLPVREDFTFDFDNLETNFRNENTISDFYYLTYKSSDADSSVKYLWGDISYYVDKDQKEVGTYRIAEGKNAFLRADKDGLFFKGTLIEKFRESFAENRERIENLLKEHSQEKYCFLHFDFQGERKHWYEFKEEFEALNNKFLQEFIGEKQNGEIVLRKSLYKTLASPEKNLPFPNFSASNIYKTRTFQRTETEDQILDLIYAINYSTKAAIFDNDIKVIILPKSKYLTAEKIEEFFEPDQQKSKNLTIQSKSEEFLEKAHNKQKKKALQVVDSNEPDELLQRALEIQPKENEEIKFDFIFSKAGGMTAPDVDMIELSGIKQSYLANLSDKIIEVRNDVDEKRKNLFPNAELQGFDIRRSFLNILGDVSKGKKKYQSHLLKVLPQIYSGNYYRDDVLLSAFIEKAEYNIRNDKGSLFNFLKFDYEFLVRLRNKNGDKEMEEMFKSPSYEAGILLGQMAQPVSWKINSFEKNYAGQLSRRVTDVDNLMDFAGFLCEKLSIHEKAYPSLKEKYGIFMNKIKENPHNYDRRYFVVGFFEGFFSKFEAPEKTAAEGETE